MADYARKQPFVQTISGAIDWRIQSALAQEGWKLPCIVESVKNSIVTVNFETTVSSPMVLPKITIPMIGPEYIRYPIQKGCKGFTIAADVWLGGVSGYGDAEAPMSNSGNLSDVLVFVPISSVKWSNTDDPNSVVIYGPNGVILRDIKGGSTITVTPNNITVKAKSEVTVEASTVNLNGKLVINGQPYLQHTHTNVQPGPGNSGPVSNAGLNNALTTIQYASQAELLDLQNTLAEIGMGINGLLEQMKAASDITKTL